MSTDPRGARHLRWEGPRDPIDHLYKASTNADLPAGQGSISALVADEDLVELRSIVPSCPVSSRRTSPEADGPVR